MRSGRSRDLRAMSGRHRHRGQALVEFALVIPLFLLLLFGIVDAGRLVFTYNAVSNAARDGARVAIVNQSSSGVNTCDTTQPNAYPVGCVLASSNGIVVRASDVTVEYHDYTDAGDCGSGAPASYQIGCIASVTVQ